MGVREAGTGTDRDKETDRDSVEDARMTRGQHSWSLSHIYCILFHLYFGPKFENMRIFFK